MDTKGKRQIAGSLTIPMIGCWVIFGIHFIYIGVFHGICQHFLSIWDIIIDVILLFSLESIAVLITLSNSRNSYLLLKISFIISIVNVLFVLFSIFIIIFTLFVKGKMNDFIMPEEPWPKTDGVAYEGILLTILKVIEISPLIILIISLKKIGSPVGTINPDSISGNIVDKNEKEEEDDLLY